jgi:uncharacterized protein (DUF1800 family)
VTSTRRVFLTEGAAAGLAVVALGTTGCSPAFPWLPTSPPTPGPFRSPDVAEPDVVTRLLRRCTFGTRPGDEDAVRGRAASPRAAAAAWIEEQLAPEGIEDAFAERRVRAIQGLEWPVGELFELKKEVLRHDLAQAALLRAVYSNRQLYEVMVEFWTDHFNIDISKGDCAWLKAADDREVIRRHALGRFPDLLRASALSPAMLTYLDGRTNRRATADERPNENYARELLELHTLGVHGGYTQEDVMDAARCLTGWAVRPRDGFRKGRVEFHAEWHDDGPKRVLGRAIPAARGERDLDELLGLVAVHPSTAQHVARKLCRRFIADEPRPAAVAAVAETFLRTGGDIRSTLRALFATPEFLGDEPGARTGPGKLKRPFHYVASALRATDAATDGGAPLLSYLAAMGHTPFAYPTPDGFPQEPRVWRDTMLWRFKLAAALAEGALEGTRLSAEALVARAGSERSLLVHLFGRSPSAAEMAVIAASPDRHHRLALGLAAPAFQRF